MKLHKAQENLRQRLTAVSDSPSLDGQVLLAHLLGRSRSWVLAHPEADLTAEQAARLEVETRQLESGLPLPYILGEWEFFGLRFNVTPQVLIPRPETELLVEQALAWLQAHPRRRLALDVGCGSGAIAAALAVKIADLNLLATDISPAALHVARSNLNRHALSERVLLVQADLLPPGKQRFDLICANLPYIPSATLASLKVYHHEPALALDGGPDGLDLVRRLLPAAAHRLAAPGCLLAEIEASQGMAARRLAQAAFPAGQVELLRDLSGHDRLIRVENR